MQATNEHRAPRFTLEENVATSVMARPGTVICCASGKLWVTQEGDAQDYVVPAGTAYHSVRSARIVVTGLESGSAVIVREAPAAAAARAGGVHIASLGTLMHATRVAQAQHFAALLEWIGACAMGAGRRMVARLRPVRDRRVAVPLVAPRNDCCA